MRVEQRTGIDCLRTASELLQRVRAAHPVEGLYEAADLQWWWRKARSTDELGHLFWFADGGLPVAGVVLTDWDTNVALVPMFLPGPTPELVNDVIERGLANAAAAGIGDVVLEVDREDEVLLAVLADRGFTRTEDGVVEAWLRSELRPDVSALHDGYRLMARSEVSGRTHHMASRGGPDEEGRLQQTPLYRDDLDLVVYDNEYNVAAYGLFWMDPVNSTALVEPMRTEDDHQRRGLARHLLTAGVDRLANAGAERIKICFEPDNPGASRLYLSVGFEPVKHTDVYAGPTAS